MDEHQAQTIKIEDIVPYERNPRVHSPEQVKLIAASLQEYGWTVPVLLDSNMVLIAGHGRVDAAKLLGWTEVRGIIRDDLTEAQVRAYRIADNRIAEMSTWDRAALQEELTILREADFPLDLTGWDDAYYEAYSVPDDQVLEGEITEPQIGLLAEREEWPTAIIRFRTEEARESFEEWIEEAWGAKNGADPDYIVSRKGNLKSYQIPKPRPSVVKEGEGDWTPSPPEGVPVNEKSE